MKKCLSILLVLALLLTHMTLPVLAEDDAANLEQTATAEDNEDTANAGDDEEPAEEEEPGEEEPAQEYDDVYPDEFVVGHPTVLKGDFFTEMFGNDTADIDVRALIHGYNLVNWDQEQGVYVIDTSVVSDVLVTSNAEGDKTYYLALYDDLCWNDGTPITAWDYAFSLLFMMSPEVEEIGGKIYRAEHIKGFDEYITKKVPYLSGVQVLDDHQISITLRHEFLPFFFEIGLLLCCPYPISEIAPGCKVYDDGYGVYIDNEDRTIEEPIYTAELLMQTVLDPDTGYNSHPYLTCGPYNLIGFDGITAHFVKNDYFKGTMYGEYPYIPRIAFTLADNDTLIQKLLDGEFQLVNKVVNGDTIDEGLAHSVTLAPADGYYFDYYYFFRDPYDDDKPHIFSRPYHLYYSTTNYNTSTYTTTSPAPTEPPAATDAVKEDDGAIPLPSEDGEADDGKDEVNSDGTPVDTDAVIDPLQSIAHTIYPRIGMSFFTFSYEKPTVHEIAVRQAIAWCMDRNALTEDYCNGWGVRVDGYYGIAHWCYMVVNGLLDYPVDYPEDEDDEEAIRRYEAEIAAWELLNLDQLTDYEVDVPRAIQLLESAGWTLNRNGEPYVAGVDDCRCKYIDDELVALDLSLMYPEGNHIVDHIQEMWIDHLNEAGILLTLVPTDMQDLFYYYYRETADRPTDMIYLATNFHVIVDPSITYSVDTELNHKIWNNTFSDDQELWWRAVDMRKTEPGMYYEYVTKWIAFQERYNEVLPAIPLYSNFYFDFYTTQLHNYNITAHVTWTQAILDAYYEGDPNYVPPENPEVEPGTDDGNQAAGN